MNLNNIELEKRMKYKDLCKMLEIEAKSDTKAKKRQFKDIQRYLHITKDKTWYTIHSIKEVVEPKIENRGRPLEIGEDTDICLLSYFKIRNDEGINEMDLTNGRLGEIVGFVNSNYRTAKFEKNRYYNYMNDEHNPTNIQAMYEVLFRVRDKLRDRYTFPSSLGRLQNQGYISFKEATFIKGFGYGSVRIADISEQQIIEENEKKILEEMGYKSKSEFSRKDTVMSEFYSELDKENAEKISDYVGMFIMCTLVKTRNSIF